MKRIASILVFMAACAVQAAEVLPLDQSYPAKQFAPASSDVKVTLRVPPSAMIGDDILATLVIENTGASALEITLGGDYRTTGYSQRMKVRALNEASEPLPELSRESYGGGGGGLMSTKTIQPGQTEEIAFGLEYYVSFTKAGVYRITAGHDLGWKVNAAHPHPFGQATITVTEPTETQAAAWVAKIFDRMSAPSTQQASFEREMNLERQLCVLRHPAYLPSLVERANAGSKAAVAAIGHIANTDATTALIALLDHQSPEVVIAAARQIFRRLPSRDDPARCALQAGWGSPYQIDPLLPASWNSRFEPPLRAAAAKMIGSDNIETVEIAAKILQARGGPADAPAVLAALQKSLDVAQPSRTGPRANTLDAPRPQKALIEILDALRAQGWRIKYGGRTAQLVAWFCQLADPAVQTSVDERTRQSMMTWIENGPPTLRICALQAIPQPMPDVYEPPVLRSLDAPDWGVLRVACETAGKSKRPAFARPLTQIVEMANETFLQNAAHDAAVACGAKMELWQAWATVIPYQDRTVRALSALILGTIELPPSNGYGSGGNFTRDQFFAIRDAWRAFLSLHQADLSAGKRIALTDPETIAGLTGMKLRPGQPVVEISFRDGTRWPPRPKK
ncbi:MAG: hypothetical protein WC661_00045 [Opitutaceae bacterium]|jgi:hypothetical protein